jgi:hypothetical protein
VPATRWCFGDRYQHELWEAGGSACTELPPEAGLGEADAVDTAQCSLLSAVSGVSVQCPSPWGACAFCMAERCVHCPISRR